MNKSLFVLYLVIFLDAAGMGMFFPIVNNLINNPAQDFLPTGTPLSQRNLYYGVMVGLFFLFWFLGAPFLSRLSDAIGRKRALLICLVGMFIGYGLTLLAIVIKSFWVLLLGRMVAGITSGNQAVSQAAIVDMSNEHNKARYLGYTVSAFALGMILGPAIGGIFSDRLLSPDFNNRLPFEILLVFIALNIVLLIWWFNEQQTRRENYRFHLTDFITQFSIIKRNRLVRNLSIAFFTMQFAYNIFYIFISTLLLKLYHFTVLNNSMVMILYGISAAFGGMVLVPFMHKRFESKFIIQLGVLIMALMCLVLTVFNQASLPYVVVVIFMLGFSLAYTTMLKFFSDAVDEQSQGWVMGITVSLFTSGCAIVSILGGALMDISTRAPMILMTLVYFLALVLIGVLPLQKSLK
ncbi:MFS transporter [uncultured Shewanella sp.]|uniref:MFS transporter n=1 Tax=uncultured Shewanella sp. TaxID=173975 RepID=UPI00262EC283|nr:MFS transporter [uncultured Shewanella sp.]